MISFLSNRLHPELASLWQLFVMDVASGSTRRISANVIWTSGASSCGHSSRGDAGRDPPGLALTAAQSHSSDLVV
jgi:hypothetical protein